MKTSLCAILFVAACTSSSNNAVCGDGVVNAGEQCDDGNNTSGDGCSAACTIESQSLCGNGHVDTGETCDDGNTASGDGCSSTCQTESLCGNGHIDTGETCDDGNTQPSDGCSATCQTEAQYTTTASWAIKNIAGTVQACPVGYDTAAVYSQLINSSGQPVGSPVIDLFNCSAGTGTISPLYQGVYQTWIAITNASSSMTYAQSLAADVDLSTGNKTFSADIYTDGGYFSWSWTLQGAVSNNALTCAQVSGLAGVEIISTITSSTTAFTDQFTCTDGFGYTSGLPAGSYTVSADAFNASNASLGTAAALTNQVIQAPNMVTPLGTITIPITGQ